MDTKEPQEKIVKGGVATIGNKIEIVIFPHMRM